MRLLVQVLLALVMTPLTAPAFAGDVEPHITDPAYDVGVYPRTPAATLPEPSVDLRSITLWMQGNDLVVEFSVENLDFRNPIPLMARRTFGLSFVAGGHDGMGLAAYENSAGEWHAALGCYDGSAITCLEALDAPIVDGPGNTVTLQVPFDMIGSPLRGPWASSHIAFGSCGCHLWSPTAGFADQAPNDGPGPDYDPFAAT